MDEQRVAAVPDGLHSVVLIRSAGSQAAASSDAAVLLSGDRVATTLAEKRVVVDTDDHSLLPVLFVVFGGDDGRNEQPFFHAVYRDRLLAVYRNGALLGADDLFFGLEEPDCPYRLDGATISFRDDGAPQFTLVEGGVRVHDTSRWREAIGSLLSRAFQRLLADLVVMHASSAGIGGRGVMFVGYQNAGKSTLALTLAARGHDFLSDEFACYDPKSHEILPYRRPVGIRPGPQGALITRALGTANLHALPHEDSLRVQIETLIPLSPPRRLPLHGVVFLDGFTADPAIRYVEAGRNEVGMLQTLYSSFINAPHLQRTFELVRLLSRSRVAYLKIGEPDATAALLEEEFGS